MKSELRHCKFCKYFPTNFNHVNQNEWTSKLIKPKMIYLWNSPFHAFQVCEYEQTPSSVQSLANFSFFFFHKMQIIWKMSFFGNFQK